MKYNHKLDFSAKPCTSVHVRHQHHKWPNEWKAKKNMHAAFMEFSFSQTVTYVDTGYARSTALAFTIPTCSNYTAFHFYYVCMIDGRWRANRAYNERQLTYKFQLANSCVCIWHGSIGRNLSDRARHCVPRVDGVHVSVFHSVHIDGELTCCSWLGGSIFVHDNFEHFTKNIRLCAYYCLIHGNCGEKQWQKKKKKFVALVQCFYASGNTR